MSFAVGGQAVPEGVMMRGPERWAVAVRRSDGTIEVHSEAAEVRKAGRIPGVRGITALVESLRLGMKAMHWATSRYHQEAGDEVDGKTSGLLTIIAFAFAIGFFIVLPAFLGRIMLGWAGNMASVAAEGALRIGMLLGYLWLLGHSAELRWLFGYHGAEHKSIAAYESGDPLTVPEAQKYSTAHQRCGTTFLLVVAVVAAVVHVFVRAPNWEWLVVSRILLVPVVAAISYELIQLAVRHPGRISRCALAPGLALQRLTTREPSDAQVEVALVALQAALSEVPVSVESPVIVPATTPTLATA